MLFHDDLYKAFDALSRGLLSGAHHPAHRLGLAGPSLNLYEHDDHYTAELAVPGAKPESLEVTVEDGVLTIAGERPAPELNENEKHLRRERGCGAFTRKIRLGREVNRDAVSADYEHGILRVTLPKAEAARPKRIAIEVRG